MNEYIEDNLGGESAHDNISQIGSKGIVHNFAASKMIEKLPKDPKIGAWSQVQPQQTYQVIGTWSYIF